ncbi:MAG: rhomboid family intramembrane serine protease [Planctomycetota bacterium]
MSDHDPRTERTGLLQFADRRACNEAALVLAAQGYDWAIVELPPAPGAGRRYVLTVPTDQAGPAHRELSAYATDQRSLRLAEPAPEPIDSGVAGAFGYGALLALFFLLSNIETFGVDWRSLGRGDSFAVDAGELWRIVTALFLHADLQHVLSNLFFGCLFGVLLAHVLGSGVAWLATLVAAALGNWLNDVFRSEQHLSIGASTAVFAALGLLVGVESLRRRRLSIGAARRFGPIMLGGVLLAWFGTGGERTDVGAHVGGFVGGSPLSAPTALAAARVDLRSPGVQWGGGALAVGVVLASWALAVL